MPRLGRSAQRGFGSHSTSASLLEEPLRLLLIHLDTTSEAEALIALLGDLSVPLMALASMDADEKALEYHQSLLMALSWKLFLLFGHADADVRNGAAQRWSSLIGWLRVHALLELQELLPALQSLSDAELTHWIVEHKLEMHAPLETVLGHKWREAQQHIRQEASAFAAGFSKMQERKMLAEQQWQQVARSQLAEFSHGLAGEMRAATSALDRMLDAALLEDRARHRARHRSWLATIQRVAFERCVWALPHSSHNVLSAPAIWAVDERSVTARGTRHKLQRDVDSLASSMRPWLEGVNFSMHASTLIAASPRQAVSSTHTRADRSGAPEQGGEQSRSVSHLLDCPTKVDVEDIFEVGVACGMETTPALLVLRGDRFSLLYGHALVSGPDGEGAFARSTRRGAHASESSSPARQYIRDRASLGSQLFEGETQYQSWLCHEVREALCWRLLQQPNGLLVLLRDGTAVLLRVTQGEARRNELWAKIRSMREPVLRQRSASGEVGSWLPSSGSYPSSTLAQLTDAWQHCRMSNFDYLMLLNQKAGRCYNVTQWPVYPWVVREYASGALDLTSRRAFRDLQRPMGAQTAARAEQFRKRHDEWEDPNGEVPAFHYGTHYSSAAAVCSFLLRLQPFAEYHCSLQDGRFDLADRLFHSVSDEWGVASGELGHDTGCVKELVPEMYYLPELYYNVNRLALGMRQDETELHHVRLPPWARGSAWRFVCTLRQALESSSVSRELPSWIDLIFGHKQVGEAAVAALNVFYMCGVDVSAIADPKRREEVLTHLRHFGQTPDRLWRERPHPKRFHCSKSSWSSVPLAPLLLALASEPLLELELTQEFVARWPVRSLSLGRSGAILALPHNAILLNHSQLVLEWGHLDGSLRVFSMDCARSRSHAPPAPKGPLGSLHGLHQSATISCACLSSCGSSLVTADAEGGVAVWELAHQGTLPKLALRGRLGAHSSVVTHLACSGAQQLLASVSKDGLLLLWCLRRLLLVHVLQVAPKEALGEGAHRGRVVTGLQVRDSNGEIFVSTPTQVQMWSPNGALIAVSTVHVSPVLCMSLTPSPEWMAELHPVIATGHQDGSVRWWLVREPESLPTLCKGLPFARSHVPVNGTLQPPLELAELRQNRLQVARREPLTSLFLNDGEKPLLLVGDASGAVWACRTPTLVSADVIDKEYS